MYLYVLISAFCERRREVSVCRDAKNWKQKQHGSDSVSLFVYSRQSGRLIKHSVDGSSVLGLTSSGTQFCQGSTILVDDIHGKLPLNPTKQDLAFGEEANGESIGPIFTHGCRLSPSSIRTFVLLNMFISLSHFRNAACPRLQMFSGFDKVVQRSNLSDSRGCGGFQLQRR
jgi:hypothetical protein